MAIDRKDPVSAEQPASFTLWPGGAAGAAVGLVIFAMR